MIFPFLNNKYFESKLSSTPEGWRLPVLLFVLNILFFATFAWLLPIRFETNDDTTMLLLASGKITGTPEAQLVYVKYILGLLLSKSYSFCDKIEWYTIYLFSLHVCSFTIIIWQIIQKKGSNLLKWLYIFLFYVIEIRLLLTFQFTTTAALAALAGLILITKTPWFHKIIGLVLFLFAILLRFESTYLVCVIFSPFYIQLIYPFKKTVFYKSLVIIIVGLMLIMVCQFLHTRAYQQSNDWKYFTICNKYRGFITDNPNTYKANNKLAVSNNDFSLYMKFLVDTKIFSLPVISEMAKNIDQVPFTVKLKHIIATFHAYIHFLILLAIICFIIIVNTKLSRDTIIILLSCFIFIAIFSFIASDKQVKYRVFISALLPLLFIFALHSSYEFKPIVNYCICFFILLFCFDFSITTYKIRKEHIGEKRAFIEQKQIVDSYLKDSSHRLLPFYNRLALENLNPFHVSDQMHFNQIINSGWLSYYPYNRRVFPSFKSFSEGLALFISNKDTQIVSKLSSCLLDNYAITVKPIVVLQSPHYKIVRFVKE
jgi:hypothetical protein